MAGEDNLRGHGQRMRKLQNAFHVTVKYALRGVPQDEFQAYFPEGALPDEVVGTAYDGYSQVIKSRRIKPCTGSVKPTITPSLYLPLGAAVGLVLCTPTLSIQSSPFLSIFIFSALNAVFTPSARGYRKRF